jgi:hypothetical protein
MDHPEIRAESTAQQEIERLRGELDEARLALRARRNEQPLVHTVMAQAAAAREVDRLRDRLDWVHRVNNRLIDRAERYRTRLARVLHAAQDPQWLQCQWRTRERATGVWNRSALSPSPDPRTKDDRHE